MIDILNWIKISFDAVFGWFYNICNSVGAWTLVLAVVGAVIAARMLLLPMFEGAIGGSDMVTRSKNNIEKQNSAHAKQVARELRNNRYRRK